MDLIWIGKVWSSGWFYHRRRWRKYSSEDWFVIFTSKMKLDAACRVHLFTANKELTVDDWHNTLIKAPISRQEFLMWTFSEGSKLWPSSPMQIRWEKYSQTLFCNAFCEFQKNHEPDWRRSMLMALVYCSYLSYCHRHWPWPSQPQRMGRMAPAIAPPPPETKARLLV